MLYTLSGKCACVQMSAPAATCGARGGCAECLQTATSGRRTIRIATDTKRLHHLPVQILICQNLRNNLMHPNEYIRGVTLRFLCRIKEEEILEPLTPSILQNLEHRCDAPRGKVRVRLRFMV